MIDLVYDIQEAYAITRGPGGSWVWPGNDFYLVTCHGDENGCMYVMNEEEETEVDPWMLQGMVYATLLNAEGGYDTTRPIHVVCCYPAKVWEMYACSLKTHNMRVLGDWNEPTRIVGSVLLQIQSESEYNALGGAK